MNHFMSQDQSIPRRNKVDRHMAKDDPILTTMRFIPKHKVVQKYGAILPDYLTNQAIKESEAYKTYYDLATGKVLPKLKYVTKSGKKKQFAEGLETLSGIALTEAEQMNIVTKRSKTQLHSSHASSLGTDEGTGVSPGVPDVPTYGSEDEQISWKSIKEDNNEDVSLSKDDDDDVDDQEYDGQDDEGPDDVNEQTDSDNDGDDFVHPKFSTQDQEERQDEEDKEEEGANVEGEEMDEEETNEEEEVDELYRDVNVNLEGRDTEMPDVNSRVLLYVPVTTIAETPLSSAITLPLPPIPLITHLQQTPVPAPAIVPSSSLQDLPNFGSLFGFDHRLKTLENEFSEIKQMNQFVVAVSSILGIVDTYLANKMNEAAKQLFSYTQVKEQVTKILLRIKKTVNEQLKAEVLTRSSNKAKTSHAVAANLSELELKKILINDHDEDEEPSTGSNRGSKRRRAGKEPKSTSAPKEKTSKSTGKSKEGSKSHQASTSKSAQAEEPIHADEELEEPTHQEFNTGFTEDQPVDETTQLPNWFQKPAKPPTPDRDGNKTLPAAHGPIKPWINNLARIISRSNIRADERIVQESSRRVIPFDHFINNDLAYLRGGSSSRTYATSVTKTKAADYGHVKWIEDLVPNTMWSPVPVIYDKHALWGISHWGRKRQKFYGFTVNRESAHDKHCHPKACGRSSVRCRKLPKGLNLIRPDTYRSDLKILPTYLAYPNPRGFIYQNKDKKNKLMSIDELHKFSDDTLNDVRTALDDILKRIRMKYLPQTYWKKVDKDRAEAMIQAIDKQLKNRRIMRSLEKFVGGRPYEGDFRLLQWTI
ncbi:hypothetical protein Tco_0436655 [Tanacetum coccineum]